MDVEIGALETPKGEENEIMAVELIHVKDADLEGQDKTWISPHIPGSIHISMFLTGLWRPLGDLSKYDYLTDNPNPDTINADISSSEVADFIGKAEVLNMKKRDFSLTRE